MPLKSALLSMKAPSWTQLIAQDARHEHDDVQKASLRTQLIVQDARHEHDDVQDERYGVHELLNEVHGLQLRSPPGRKCQVSEDGEFR